MSYGKKHDPKLNVLCTRFGSKSDETMVKLTPPRGVEDEQHVTQHTQESLTLLQRKTTKHKEIKSVKHIYSHPCAQNKECSFSVKIVIFEIKGLKMLMKNVSPVFSSKGSHSTGFEADLSNLEMGYETEQFIKSLILSTKNSTIRLTAGKVTNVLNAYNWAKYLSPNTNPSNQPNPALLKLTSPNNTHMNLSRLSIYDHASPENNHWKDQLFQQISSL